METCPGEQHGQAGCWDESLGACRQDSSSSICLESLKEEGDLVGNWCVQAGKDSTSDEGQMQCSDGEPVYVLVTMQSHECFLSAAWLCKQTARFL